MMDRRHAEAESLRRELMDYATGQHHHKFCCTQRFAAVTVNPCDLPQGGVANQANSFWG